MQGDDEMKGFIDTIERLTEANAANGHFDGRTTN